MSKDIIVVLPDSARQGVRYEINGLEDDSVYVLKWSEVVQKVKSRFPIARRVTVISGMGIAESVPLDG